MRIARELATRAIDKDEFLGQAASFTRERPEINASGLDRRRRARSRRATAASDLQPQAGEAERRPTPRAAGRGRHGRARDRLRRGARPAPAGVLAGLHRTPAATPCSRSTAADRPQRLRRHADRRVLDREPAALLRAGRGDAAARRHAVRRAGSHAGQLGDRRCRARSRGRRRSCTTCRSRRRGNGLVLRSQGYRTSIGLIGNTLFWMVVALSRAHGVDAARHLAPHAPARADAGRAGLGDQLPPRDGELDAHRHARDGHGGPHHLREPGVLRDDRLRRGGTDRPPRALPALAARPPGGEQPPAAAGTAGPQPGRRRRGQGHAQGRLAVRRRACTCRR